MGDDEADKVQDMMTSIEECLESDRITAWEKDFLNSIHDQLEVKKSLSPRQYETLGRIEVKVRK